MRFSTKTKTMMAMATALTLIGAAAWAQNLEVKGNAWFATGGTGSAGFGTATPLGKLHVIAAGNFGPETAGGTAQAGNVPILAQSDGTAFGLLNASGREVFALNVEGNAGTATARGYVKFYDRYDGTRREALTLYKGAVGLGKTPGASFKLDVGGAISAGNSDIYFTNTTHSHSGIGNTTGFAAIENAANFGTLMILGRAGTSVGRRVDVWDYLQVNGRLRSTTGTIIYTVNSSCLGPNSGTSGKPTVGTLTTSATCVPCFEDMYGSWSCYGAAMSNTPVGRMVDY